MNDSYAIQWRQHFYITNECIFLLKKLKFLNQRPNLHLFRKVKDWSNLCSMSNPLLSPLVSCLTLHNELSIKDRMPKTCIIIFYSTLFYSMAQFFPTNTIGWVIYWTLLNRCSVILSDFCVPYSNYDIFYIFRCSSYQRKSQTSSFKEG